MDGWGARIRTWDVDTKNRCLTTWRRPNSDMIRRKLADTGYEGAGLPAAPPKIKNPCSRKQSLKGPWHYFFSGVGEIPI